ncbi:MAG: dihydrolipoamide acetyltransferase family protein [Anaerolineaceae bacterium]
MAIEVIMPKVDMVMETGTFVEWLKKEGEHVSKGDPLFVITTDKAAIDVESPADGVLAGCTAKADDVIPVTEVMAYILGPGESLPTKALTQSVSSSSMPSVTPAVVAPQPITTVVTTDQLGKARITPVARRLAKEMGLDLKQISGRGPRGRIHKADIMAFQKHQPSVQPPSAPSIIPSSTNSTSPIGSVGAQRSAPIPLPDARRKQVLPISGPRKIIAERMVYSAVTTPHINLSLRVDMTEVIRLREQVLEPHRAQTGQRISLTAILARMVATVLPRHPYLNASLSDGNIILWEDIHLGIATSVEENLIVPVIREAQSRSLRQIITTLADLSERARTRRLMPAEMMGSTFTISNLGMYGIESFNAIINPPEAAILAVGKIVDTPVAYEGQIVLRPLMELTACADHRIADGATVARFLADLKTTLENPYLLL